MTCRTVSPLRRRGGGGRTLRCVTPHYRDLLDQSAVSASLRRRVVSEKGVEEVVPAECVHADGHPQLRVLCHHLRELLQSTWDLQEVGERGVAQQGQAQQPQTQALPGDGEESTRWHAVRTGIEGRLPHLCLLTAVHAQKSVYLTMLGMDRRSLLQGKFAA